MQSLTHARLYYILYIYYTIALLSYKLSLKHYFEEKALLLLEESWSYI